MAVAIDASSPARVNALIGEGEFLDTASFTAPANSFLSCCVNLNGSGDAGAAVHTVSDSGGLTWTQQVARQDNETTAGATSSIWTAPQVTSASRTVRVVWTSGALTSPPRRASIKVRVRTGVDISGTPVDTVSASNEGGSLTNNITTTSVTPGANGHLEVNDSEWQAVGVFEASSDLTQESETFPGEFSLCSGWKVCTSGVGVTANLNAATTNPCQHKWCQIVIREAPSGTAVLTGTAVGGITEGNLVSGGRTVVITLTGDSFIP